MKWIFRYIDSSLEEVDYGFYKTAQEANKAMLEHASFGNSCNGPIMVFDNYKLYKGKMNAGACQDNIIESCSIGDY